MMFSLTIVSLLGCFFLSLDAFDPAYVVFGSPPSPLFHLQNATFLMESLEEKRNMQISAFIFCSRHTPELYLKRWNDLKYSACMYNFFQLIYQTFESFLSFFKRHQSKHGIFFVQNKSHAGIF